MDASRNFYPDASTVALFESQLSASQPVEQSIAALRAEIQSKLEPVAEQQALEFLDRYLSYRQRGIELGLNQDVQEDFRPRFAQLRSLRREFFGMDVGQRVFGDEEREANIALREHEILSDPDLSDEERRVLLDELYNPPPEQRE
jgi:lipase chaperone LimK